MNSGIVISPRCASVFNPMSWSRVNTVTFEFSRLVLAIQCFGNAVELEKAYVQRYWRSLAWILGPVMLVGWLITTCCVRLMVPSFDWKQCLACAACFNAIDLVLAATILHGRFSKRIPRHLRSLLRAEASANGVTTTLVLELSIQLIRYQTRAGAIAKEFFVLTLAYEVGFGTFAGVITGYLARRLVRRAKDLDMIDRPSFLAYYLSVALFTTGFGTVIGIDEINNAFFAGVGLDNDNWYEQVTEASFFATSLDLFLNLT